MGKDAGPKLGMPIDEFTEGAWKGLNSGNDEVLFISPAIGKEVFEDILVKRRQAFEALALIMRGGRKSIK
jgi:hypothetical protein